MTDCIGMGGQSILIPNLYEGIPETLILNAIVWFIFIILFTVLRYQASDYGRVTVVDSSQNNRDNNDNKDNQGKHDNRHWMNLLYAKGSNENASSLARDKGIFSWIIATLRLRKEEILLHSGSDAVHYLSFQQHLIFVATVIMLVSIVIILPINFHGELIRDISTFGTTTVSNLHPDSHVLWVHVLCAMGFVPIVNLIMKRTLTRDLDTAIPSRVIVVKNIQPENRDENKIRSYIRRSFANVKIEKVFLTYDIGELCSVLQEYEKMKDAREYCQALKPRSINVRVFPSYLMCKTVDGLDYYLEQEIKFEKELVPLKLSARDKPLRMAFVTLSSPDEARQIRNNFQRHSTQKWKISYATEPSDVIWENLNDNSQLWFYLKVLGVNVLLFIFIFFVMAPIVMVNLLTSVIFKNLSPMLSEFLPTLLLWLFTALMPTNIGYSNTRVGDWSVYKQNYSTMIKSFIYLLLMVLILPSLGFTSILAVFEWTFYYSENEIYRWECIFRPTTGAFFVNYVITSAFIGTGLDLIRFPDLMVYSWRLCTAKSEAETPHIRKSIVTEFPFGIHYAWTIMVFTLSVVYSLACPLIMPFAVIYLLLKHFNDRHNLYFAFRKTSMGTQGSRKIHSTAVIMTNISVILLLIMMAALLSVRSGGLDARSIILVVVVCILPIVLFVLWAMRRQKVRQTVDRVSSTLPGAPLDYTPDILKDTTHGSEMSERTADQSVPKAASETSSPEAYHIELQPVSSSETNV